jgi:hypothetical protein
MSLKIKIAARLKAKAAGVNLSQKRIDAIVERVEKMLPADPDDTTIDANLDVVNELTPYKEIAALDDHERAKAKKIADDKEAARLKSLEEGKPIPVDDDPNESSTDKLLKALMAKVDKQEQVIARIGQKEVATTRREQYAKALEGTSEAFKAKALKDFDRMSFKDNEDFASYLTDATEDAKVFIQEDANSGLGGDRPTGGAGGATEKTKQKVASKEEIDAIMQSI